MATAFRASKREIRFSLVHDFDFGAALLFDLNTLNFLE